MAASKNLLAISVSFLLSIANIYWIPLPTHEHATLTDKGGDLMLSVGDKLRTLRNERNLSQDRLAKKVSVTRASIATYESGNRLPSLYVLVRLARALGVTTDYLLGVSSDKASFLDVSGLTPKQIEILDTLIENFRECSGSCNENNET